MKTINGLQALLTAVLLYGCTGENIAPQTNQTSSKISAQSAGQASPWGPETGNFNLQAILRGQGTGFGLVKFRQPNDGEKVIYLDTWVRGLQPNTSYSLQRAVDTNLDGNCTGTAWLTLGKGLIAQDIITDDNGTGNAELFRDVATLAIGATFDIHFQVIKTSTGEIILNSDCYEYAISM